MQRRRIIKGRSPCPGGSRWGLALLAGMWISGAQVAKGDLTENFDASAALPAGWIDGGSTNWSNASHYKSSPNCRAMGVGDTLQTPLVDYPTNLSFYVDASSGGNNRTGTVDYSVVEGSWTPLGSFVATTIGGTKNFPLVSVPNLAANAGVRFRFNSTFNTWYLDDVAIQTDPTAATNAPPMVTLDPPGTSWSIAVGATVSVAVAVTEPDGDEITLTGIGLPDGSEFAPNPQTGLAPLTNRFTWIPAVTGQYNLVFQAVDKDGTNEIAVGASVYLPDPLLLLFEDFDDTATLPAGWTDGGTANESLHYQSSPNCRALGSNDTLTTPAVDYPTNLAFYVDSSNGGEGQMARVDYRIGTGAWEILGTFAVHMVGGTESFSLLGLSGVSTSQDVRFRFSSAFNTWYLDDVLIRGQDLTDQPPELEPIGSQVVGVGREWRVEVVARDYEQDEITLYASNLPPGAVFDMVTNAGFVTNWMVYTPLESEVGMVYTSMFYAADIDGVTAETVTVSVVERTVGFALESVSFPESAGTQQVAVVLSRPGAVTVEVVAGGSATGGAEGDYMLGATQVVFTAEGSPTQYIELVVANDALREGPETVVLTLTNAVGAVIEPGARHTATLLDEDVIFIESLDADPGWSVEDQWAFGRPLGASYDPESGNTGTNVYGYNLAGSYPHNMASPCYLTTPAIDCSRFRNVRLRFMRWIFVSSDDQVTVQASRDRTNWVEVWSNNGSYIYDWGWKTQEYDLSSLADGQSSVYVRWGMGPTDGSVAYGGWNIDDVSLEGDAVTNAMFRFATPGVSAWETASSAEIVVERIGPTQEVAEIVFFTSNRTAVAGEDFEAVEETLVFAAGECLKTVTIPLLDDAEAEGKETAGLYLNSTASGELAPPSEAVLVIQDDETPGAGLPFFDGFEEPVFSNCWATESTASGRIQLGAGSLPPYEGNGHVGMDATNYNYGRNELVLTIDLSGQTNVVLDFCEYNLDYQKSPLPAVFAGSTNADGVAISTDGWNWHRLLDATEEWGYVRRSVDLSAFAASNGLVLGRNVEIKFQQYDRYWLPYYGRCFDNVQVYDPTEVADVRVTVRESEDPVMRGSNLVYALVVSNAGPQAAAGCVVSNRWPGEATLVAAEASVGECLEQDGRVVWNLGELASGAVATAAVTVLPLSCGVLTNEARVATEGFDPGRTNNVSILTTLADDPGGTLQTWWSALEAVEESGTTQVAIVRSDHLFGEVTVDFATADGTAVAGEDYVATNGTLLFTNGQTYVLVPVAILNDSADEATETFSFILSAPGGGAVLGASTSTVVSIPDDDGRAAFPFLETFESGVLTNYWRTYSTGYGRVQVTTNYGPWAGERHVTMDTEYDPALNELVLTVDLAGRTGVTLAFEHKQFSDEDTAMLSVFTNHLYADGVAMSADGVHWAKVHGLTAGEGSSNSYGYFEVALDPILAARGWSYTSTFKIKFQQYDNSTITADGFAFDDIALFARHGELRFEAAEGEASETGGVAVVRVERVNGSLDEVSVAYATADGTATAGSDYAATNGVLTFGDGVSTGSFEVVIYDDAEDEPAETLVLALSDPAGGATVAFPSNLVLTLGDNDGPGEIGFAAEVFTVSESDTEASIEVWRTGGAEGEVAVNYSVSDGTASNGWDYTAATGTLVFAAGVTQQWFAVGLLDDNEQEDTETAGLSLDSPTGGAAVGAPGAAVLRIVDDEDPNYLYYLSAFGKEGSELRQALHDIIDGHTAWSYDTLWTVLQQTDECPTNAAQVQLVYLQKGRDKSNNGGAIGQWNREHLWPQSHGFPDALSTAVPPSVDAYNLKPSDVAVNSLRGEKDFDTGGEAVAGAPASCRTTGSTFEPPDESKGDIARSMFYMDVRYSGDVDGEPDLELVEAVDTSGTQLGRLSTLIRWHFQDPPDDFEMRRNGLIQTNWQGNRNPFVDHPEWVLKIWEYNMAIATRTDGCGSVAPENPQVPYHSDEAFAVQPDAYWHIADIRTNGVSLGADYGTSSYAFVWGEITSTGMVEAVFAANLATNGTPEWWLAGHGCTGDFEVAAMEDLDEDGYPAWMEYRAGTDPNDRESLLHIAEVDSTWEENRTVLSWPSASNRWYSLWRAAAVPDGFGQAVATNLAATPPVNVYTDTIDGAETWFYRIEVGPVEPGLP